MPTRINCDKMTTHSPSWLAKWNQWFNATNSVAVRMALADRKSTYPGSLTDLHRFRRTAHGHDGSSRIVMVRKTDQRTFASIQTGKTPTLETVTRETIETFCGQRTACKVTTEKKSREENVPSDLIEKVDRSRCATPAKGSSKAKILERFQVDCLNAHNAYRKRHGVPPLKLSKDMCRSCMEHCMLLLKKNALEHSGSSNKYGENIYSLLGSHIHLNDIKAATPVDTWYAEAKKHDFGHEPTLLATGHFTQVVWKESRDLGVAVAHTKGKLVVVAQYYPAGNVIGRFVANVPPAVASSPVSSDNNDLSSSRQAFLADFLEAHNKYRRSHAARPLTLDAGLTRFAEEWATQCAERGKLEHRKNNPYGENIYCIHSADPNFAITGNMPVDSWYKEKEVHNFDKEPANLSSGHFSQVVWKSSEKLGVGVAQRMGYTYIVANYTPAGNFVGHFVENVKPEGAPLSPLDEGARFAPDDLEYDQFQLDALRYHNEYRRRHAVANLALSRELCNVALDWAQHCAFHGMGHRPKNAFGENTYMAFSSDFGFTPSARDVVSTWYAQKRQHVFGVECVNMNSLHFTQLIWKQTAEMGIALAKNSKGETYVVANYKPRGNVVGEFNANVLRAKVF